MELLDQLHYDELFDAYTGTVKIAHTEVTITLYPDAEGDPEPALQHARAILTNSVNMEQQAQAHAVAALLPLKNEAWLEEGESPLTGPQFRQRMKLDTLVVYPDGEVTFYYQDGDLFWGHTIAIGFDPAGEFKYADIPG